MAKHKSVRKLAGALTEVRKSVGEAVVYHSREPWTAKEENANAITIRDANGEEIASVYNENVDVLTTRQRADGRLVVEAPAMKRALEGMLKATEELMSEIGSKRASDWGVINQALLDADAVLGRVKGRGGRRA